jgi:hypothetical protein
MDFEHVNGLLVRENHISMEGFDRENVEPIVYCFGLSPFHMSTEYFQI